MIGETSTLHVRYDRFTPAADSAVFERLPNGAIRTTANVARVGIYKYQNADGSVRRELVDEDTLSDPEWLASCKGAPITNDHPPENVTTVNMRQYRIGVALSKGEFKKPFHVQTDFQIDAADGLDAIDFGRLEVSPGYVCETVGPAGVHAEYGAYDVIQRNRRCNHIAICDNARGGSECRILRVDSTDTEVGIIQDVPKESKVDAVPETPLESPKMTLSPVLKDVLDMMKIKYDDAMCDDDAKALIAKKIEEDEGKKPAPSEPADKQEPAKDAAKVDEGAYSAEALAKIAALEAEVKKAGEAKVAAEVALQKALEEHEMADMSKAYDEAMDDPDGAMMDATKMDSARMDAIKAKRRKHFDAFNALCERRERNIARAVACGLKREDAVKLGNRALVKSAALKVVPALGENRTTAEYETALFTFESVSRRVDSKPASVWEQESKRVDAIVSVKSDTNETPYVATV